MGKRFHSYQFSQWTIVMQRLTHQNHCSTCGSRIINYLIVLRGDVDLLENKPKTT